MVFVPDSRCSLKKIPKIACHLRTTVLVLARLGIDHYIPARAPAILSPDIFISPSLSPEPGGSCGNGYVVCSSLQKLSLQAQTTWICCHFFTGMRWFIQVGIGVRDLGCFWRSFPMLLLVRYRQRLNGSRADFVSRCKQRLSRRFRCGR